LHLLSALLSTLLSGLLPALLPGGLVLISVCHKYISPSISIRFIDNSCGVAGADHLAGSPPAATRSSAMTALVVKVNSSLARSKLTTPFFPVCAPI
jgi:hypothetical protein